jgi:hypothetical protein
MDEIHAQAWGKIDEIDRVRGLIKLAASNESGGAWPGDSSVGLAPLVTSRTDSASGEWDRLRASILVEYSYRVRVVNRKASG